MRKIKVWVISAVLASVYFVFLYYRCSLVPIDSDYANLVLEAADILQGNFFRTGWNLTGISFLASDLLYFIVGVILAGVSKYAYYIAVTLMQFTLVIASLKLLCCGKNKLSIYECMIFISVGLLPCLFTIELLRAHTGVFVWTFLGIFCIYQILNDTKGRNLYFFSLILLFAFGTMSDPIILVIGTMPILLWGISCWVVRKERNILTAKIMLFSLVGVALGMVADKIYFAIGNANKNSFLSTKYFEGLDDYGRKFLIYIRALLGMMDSQFENTPIISINTLFYFINTIVLICALILMSKAIIDFFRKKRYDVITLLFSFGFVLISVLFIITNISESIGSARYLGYFPIMFAIIIARNIPWVSLTQLEVKALLATVSLLLLFGGSIRSFRDVYIAREWEQLATFLEENNLRAGYASFWNASSVTVLTKQNVRIRAITTNTGRPEPFRWFCKDNWYTEPANFIIVNNEDEMFHVNPKPIEDTIGKPADILKFNNYDIYIYDTDISKYVFNGFSDSSLYPSEMFGNENTLREKGEYVLHNKGMLYGPYAPLGPGRYEVICEGEGMDGVICDAFSNTEGIIQEKVRIEEASGYSFSFELDNLVEDLEIRLYNNSDNDIILRRLVVSKK